MTVNTRVTGNVIHDIITAWGAVFLENSTARNFVDHNVMWNINGQCVRGTNNQDLIVAHNLMVLVRGPVIKYFEWDFAGRERMGETTIPGPFMGLSNAASFSLERRNVNRMENR